MRPTTHAGALLHASSARKAKEVGRFGIILTTKRKGDWEWSPQQQEWVQFSKGAPGQPNKRRSAPLSSTGE